MTVKKYDIQKSEKRNKSQLTEVNSHRKLEAESPKLWSEVGEDPSKSHIRNVNYFQLYRFSTITEKCWIVCGLILSTIASLGIPYALVNSGEFHTLLIERHTGNGTSSETTILKLFGGGRVLKNASKEENMMALKEDALAFGISSLAGAIVEWILLAASLDIFNRVAVKQINRIQKQFLASLLRQDMSWYDTASDSNFAGRMTEDLSKLKEGIGEKVAIFTNLSMSFVSTMILSFFFGLDVTLIILICCPIIIVSTIVVEKIQSFLTEKELRSYCLASSVAEEVISAIRTVFAFSGELKETERYNKLLNSATKAGHRKGLYSGICSGAMWIIIYSCFAMALFYAAKLTISREADRPPAVLITLLLGIILEAQSIGFAMPHLESFGAAKSAAKSIFAIIDRKTNIDPCSEEGIKPEKINGNIEFEKINFKYPSRPDVKVLRGLSVSIKAGQTVAFVGPSGCGKSTCLQLLQRFYDPQEGTVSLDGIDVRKLNVSWLRSQIGLVGQEPVLFSTTIAENVRYGNPLVSQQEIEEACKLAYCHDFITQLPGGYGTMVGEMGSQMSGGQKQRIAIARALVRNPKILLLDEATSALDHANEKLVQTALEAAQMGRTTIMVAHRLSTVRNADLIVFIKDGTVMEQGNHEHLMELRGYYYNLMNASERTQGNCKNPLKQSSFSQKKLEVDALEKNEVPEEKNETESEQKYFQKLLKLNSPEWKYLLLGSMAAVLQGSTGIIWSIYFGEFIGFMSDINNEFEEKANTVVLISVAIGVLAGLSSFTQTYMLNVAGTNLTSRLRQKAFKSIIAQDVEYFDDPKNSVGALCSRLSGDCSNVQGATGSRLAIVIQSVSALTIAIIASLTLSWNLTLVTMVLIPFGVGAIVFESNYTEKSSEEERLAKERAAQLAVESVANIRTINSLGQEKYALERYVQQINLADEASKQKTRYRGIVFGFGDASQCIVFGISLFYGGLLVADGYMEYKNIIKISEALQLGTWMMGQAFAYAPDFSDAFLSMRRLLKLFDSAPTISCPKEKSLKNFSNKCDISYTNVGFHYPHRKNNPVLKDFNLQIPKNSTIALVGPSGCGKSTSVQLLLRYYDPNSGTLSLNDIPSTDYQLQTLRSQISLVSQEPVLFGGTIAENIAYGDNSRHNISISEIIEAAKKANIHSFIVNLPHGYKTSISSKGSQLSCGQKQRIAIARAFIRNPRILILDEATSALDMESEKLVQAALETASCGRTCIMIAQRLSTIKNADMICVVENGHIAEQGTHEELMEMKGSYAELLSMQQ